MSVKDDRVAISLTVDKGVKERALKVLGGARHYDVGRAQSHGAHRRAPRTHAF